MSYVDQTVSSGETVVARAKVHWVVYLRPAFLFALSLLLFIAGISIRAKAGATPGAAMLPNLAGTLSLIAAAISALFAVLAAMNTELAVTNRRVIAKTGILSRHTIEQRLDKVDSLRVNQPILGRILGYGHVTVIGSGSTSTTAGKDSKDAIRNIADPMTFRRSVEAAITEMENRPRA